jgi:hypothetical protein
MTRTERWAGGLLVVLVAARSEPGEKWGRFTLDRSGWLSVNASLLTSALVFVTAGSAYPAFASLFFGESVSVDTRFFDGNQPLAASIEAATEPEPGSADWFELVPRTELGANAQTGSRSTASARCGPPPPDLPDGGVARLGVYGKARSATERSAGSPSISLRRRAVVRSSRGDEHFGAAAKLLWAAG